MTDEEISSLPLSTAILSNLLSTHSVPGKVWDKKAGSGQSLGKTAGPAVPRPLLIV
jgi:hypothetical protein